MHLPSPSESDTALVILARTGSSRFPGKVLEPFGGQPMLAFLLERVRRANRVGTFVLATTSRSEDDQLAEFAAGLGMSVYRGDSDDVLGRLARAARLSGKGTIAVVLGDNPLVDGDLVDAVLTCLTEGGFDYAANVTAEYSVAPSKLRRFPIGIRVQAFTSQTLAELAVAADGAYYREHVSAWINEKENKYRLGFVEAVDLWQNMHRPEEFLAVNTPQDLAHAERIWRWASSYDAQAGLQDFRWAP